MKRMSLMVIALVAGLGSPTFAQQSQGVVTSAGSGQGQGQGQGRGTTTVTAGQGRGMTRSDAQATNIRLDITITDQNAGGQPIKKSISLLIADQSSGRVRSSATLTQEYLGPGMVTPDGQPIVSVRPVGEVQLNVDANVFLLGGDAMRAGITLEYTPGAGAPLPANSAVTMNPLNQSVTVILQNGKPLIITQAADPLSDRKITVEVVGTILR